MSAAAWESPLAPNHDTNGAFNGTIDPSAMGFNASPDFDFGQMQDVSMPPHLQNGIQRNGSPASFHQPTYQTTSVVPSKRPHADTISNSPRQASRSITPQQPHFPQTFQTSNNGQPTPNGFGNFNRVNSTTASPSPVMPNQQFNPNGVPPQRLATTSPSPFSPAATNAGLQMSPAPSDFSNHGDAGQNGVPNFGQPNPYMNGHGAGSPAFNTPNTPNTPMMPQAPQMHNQGNQGVQMNQGMPMNPQALRMAQGMQMNPQAARMNPQAMQMNPQVARMNPQAMQMNPQAVRMTPQGAHMGMQGPRMNPQGMAVPPNMSAEEHAHRLRIAKQQQMRQQGIGPGAMSMGPGGLPGQAGGVAVGAGGPRSGMQTQGLPPQVQHQMQQIEQSILNPFQPRDNFVPGVMQFNKERGKGFEPRLVIAAKQVHPVNLWTLVMQHGGSAAVTERGLWMQIAVKLQAIPPPQQEQDPDKIQLATNDMQTYWDENLSDFEAYKQQERGDKMSTLTARVASRPMNGPQMPSMLHMRRTSGLDAPQVRPGLEQRPGTQESAVNPVVSAQVETRPTKPAHPSQRRASQQRTMKNTDPYVPAVARFSTAGEDDSFAVENHGIICLTDKTTTFTAKRSAKLKPAHPSYLSIPIERSEASTTTGPLEMLAIGRTMGMIDIHSLKMALKSGITGEVRVALDTLSQLSFAFESQESGLPLALRECDDLVEALTECAESQLDLLENNSFKVPGEARLLSYSELVRRAQDADLDILDIPEAGTLDFDLDLAAERLLCIVQILQNLSSADDQGKISASNIQGHPSGGYRQIWLTNMIHYLTSPGVISMLTKVIQAVASKDKVLRSHRNTLDFYKDAVLFLANISEFIVLTSKDETFHILQFLHCFGPMPDIKDSEPTLRVTFHAQNPQQHRYLRFAVDALAKLLARDEPNRAHFRSVFTSEQAPYRLFTQTFGLAIAPVPATDASSYDPASSRHVSVRTQADLQIVEWRQAYMKQGLLAADVLTELLPSGVSNLAQAWLHSSDGWSTRLISLIRILGFGQLAAPNGHPLPHVPEHLDKFIFPSIVERALNILQCLVERSREDEGEDTKASVTVARQHRIATMKLLRSAHEAWGSPPPNGQPQDRTRVRRILRQIELLVDLEA